LNGDAPSFAHLWGLPVLLRSFGCDIAH
jgi:hypothetical protein